MSRPVFFNDWLSMAQEAEIINNLGKKKKMTTFGRLAFQKLKAIGNTSNGIYSYASQAKRLSHATTTDY